MRRRMRKYPPRPITPATAIAVVDISGACPLCFWGDRPFWFPLPLPPLRAAAKGTATDNSQIAKASFFMGKSPNVRRAIELPNRGVFQSYMHRLALILQHVMDGIHSNLGVLVKSVPRLS